MIFYFRLLFKFGYLSNLYNPGRVLIMTNFLLFCRFQVKNKTVLTIYETKYRITSNNNFAFTSFILAVLIAVVLYR